LEITPWLVWFLEQVEDAAELAHSTFARILGKARFWLRFQAVEINERQRKVLNRLLDAGPGGFAGGINNRKSLGLTRTSRATAWRELSDLVAKGCLVPTGKGGRSSAYEIPWAELA
jgi:Fic family protein